MFRGSILLKTFAMILFFAAVYFILLNFVFVNFVQDEIEKDYVEEMKRINKIVAAQLVGSVDKGEELKSETYGLNSETDSEQADENASAVALTAEQIADVDMVNKLSDAQLWIVSVDGIVMYDTAGKFTGENVKGEGYLNKEKKENDVIYEILDDDSLSVVESLNNATEGIGYIISHMSYDTVSSAVDNELVRYNTVGLLAFIIVLLVGMGTAIDSKLILSKLTRLTVEYSEGKFEERINLQFADEHQRLSDAICCLAEKMQGLVEYQKDFIANISHDFRSPLTSIKGYVGAIKDGTIPYKSQDRYLDIILFETERLTGLTQDLLQLNEIDNKALRLEITEFNVCDMIKQSARTFEAVCASKKLKIRLVLAEREIWVSADKSKIQQVLHNLIDNAIKFSKEDSIIEITVSTAETKVYVSVKDSGIGIPKESIDRIWERFYKTDLSRGKDKKGTGLGLAITKQIINAHGEKIEVASKVGIGTEFVFTLNKTERAGE